jgi:hypothetical protein
MSEKYIISIYKISTDEDKLRVFIGSTKKNIQFLLSFYIKNYNQNVNNHLYEWIKLLNKSKLKIKLLKSYPVSNKEEKHQRELYWINKYTKYGYGVINNLQNITENLDKKENEIIYVCLKDISMTRLLNMFGDNIISISKHPLQNQNYALPGIQSNIQENIQSNIQENTQSNITNIPFAPPFISVSKKINVIEKNISNKSDNPLMDELKNVLLQRKKNKEIK